MDVSFTDDGYPVVIHGPDLGRIKCDVGVGKKDVHEFTLQDMKDHCKLYNGQVILTLQEVLTKIASKFKRYFVDVKIDDPKEKSFIKPMLQSIKQLDLHDNIMFSSTDSDVNYQLGATKDITA
ncbi:MAG: glycerophosphodiester phosphodiesterase family protein [bacterium]